MKTIIAFSDSHNVPIPLWLTALSAESDFIFFTGDGIFGVENALYPFKDKLFAVKGNCDGCNAERELVVSVENVKFLLLHGDAYRDKTNLSLRAREFGCDCVLYGHTHAFSDDSDGGVRLINLGSLAHSPTGDIGYVFIAVNGKNIFANFVKRA